MKIPSVIVTSNRIGSINHTIMTCIISKKYRIPIKGLIINNFEKGYAVSQLKQDLEDLTDVKVLGSIPFIKDMSNSSLNRIFKKNLDIKSLL